MVTVACRGYVGTLNCVENQAIIHLRMPGVELVIILALADRFLSTQFFMQAAILFACHTAINCQQLIEVLINNRKLQSRAAALASTAREIPDNASSDQWLWCTGAC